MSFLDRLGLGRGVGVAGGFRRNVALLAGGTALGHAIALLASPFLTRLYTTEQFGQLQLYISGLTFLTVIGSLKYETAILLPEKNRDAVHILVLSLGITLGLSILTAVGAFAIQPVFLGKAEPLKPYLWMAPLGLLGAGAFQSLSNWAIRRGGYKEVAHSKLIQTGCQVATQVLAGFAFHPVGTVGLLAGDTTGRLMAGGRFIRLVWRDSRSEMGRLSYCRILRVARTYWRFPVISVGSNLLNTAGFALVPFFLARLYGYNVLGWFALVNRILGIPTLLIGQAISQAFMGEVSSHMGDMKAIQARFRGTLRNLALLGLVPFGVVFLVAPVIFPWVFGEAWRPAGRYAQAMAVGIYISFVVWPTMPMLEMLQKQKWQITWDLLRLILVTGSLYVGHRIGWGPYPALISYSLLSGLAYLMHALITDRVIKAQMAMLEGGQHE